MESKISRERGEEPAARGARRRVKQGGWGPRRKGRRENHLEGSRHLAESCRSPLNFQPSDPEVIE